MFDEPPEDQLGREPIRWIGHLAGAIGVLFFAAAVYFLFKSILAPSFGGVVVTILVGAIAAYFLIVGRRMTLDELARQRLMPPIFYRSLCVVFGSVAVIALFFAALKPDFMNPIHAIPGIAGMGWFAWMCYIAGWQDS